MTNLDIDVLRLWLGGGGYLKCKASKFRNFTMPYELTKNECFLLSFSGGG